MDFLLNIIPAAITIATVFLLGSTGETLMEKTGHLNLGIPGIMCFGTVGGCLGVRLVLVMYGTNPENANYFLLVLFALIGCSLLSALAGLIYSFLTVSLKCNQNVTGLALTTFGGGFADYFMSLINKDGFADASNIINTPLPFASSLGIFGKLVLNYNIFVYLAIAIAITVSFVLKRTRVGLSFRAIGENPQTADAVGINISKLKYISILVGSMIAGLAGVFYVMCFVGGSYENSSTIQSFGWLSLALVIFTVWKPDIAILGSILFGFLFILPNTIEVSFVVMKVLDLLPYLVTIIVLIITSISGKKSVQPPSALGLAYFREDR